jgi:hypothetical protein
MASNVAQIPDSKPHLSISQLNMLSRCGEQYRRRYVLGEKIPPAVAMLVGRAVDKSVTANLGNKMSGRGLMPSDAVADSARDAFDVEWQSGDVSLSAEEMAQGLKVVKGAAIDKSVRLSRLHAEEMAPEIEPTHLQRKVLVELTGYPYDLLGFIDIQEGHKAIRDTKTSGKTPAHDVAHKDDQLTIYAMMASVVDGGIPEHLYLDYLIDLKTPKAETFGSTRTEADFQPMLRRIETAIVAIEKGVFVPARESDWWCGEKWCGFWRTCPYVKRPKQFTV